MLKQTTKVFFIATILLAAMTLALAAGQTDYVLLSDAASVKAHHLQDYGSKIERCGGMVGLRSEYYDCRTTPALVPEIKNLALNTSRTGFPHPSASSVSVCYDVWGPVDGVNEGGEYTWTNEDTDENGSWWEIDFGKPTSMAKIVLKTWTSYALKDFDVLRWDDARKDWDTANPIAKIRGNIKGEVAVENLNLATSKLRAVCHAGPVHQAIYRRIAEFEVYPPAPPKLAVKPKWFSCRMAIPTKGKWTLEVQEVNDDKHNGDRTRYQILLDGKPVYTRDYSDLGPGLFTYFVDLPATGKPQATLKFEDTSGYGIRVRSIRAYSDFEKYCTDNRYMLPMIICPRLYMSKDKPDLYNSWEDVFAKAGAKDKLGVINIMSFAARDAKRIGEDTDRLGEMSLEKNIPMVFQYTSTWADSPLNTPDGAGGRFGDLQYQQIGYSEFDIYDDPGLKEYMDSHRPGWYDVRYGLTTPNHWSSVPWLTMNNPRLNDFRQKRLAESITQLNGWLAKMEERGMSANLLGIIGDDEPIYWTKLVDLFDDGYSKVNKGGRRTDLMLDFNWYTIQDAARDGIKLDPTDGLDLKERWWLHNNITRYNRLMLSTIRNSLRKPARGAKDDYRLNLYVYAMEDPGFPLSDQYHPLWETGIFPESAVGIEAMKSKYFPRARELARIANSDFECAGSTPERVKSWLPVVRDYYENGVRFIQFCNPGDAANWGPVAELMAHPTPEMDRKRMESLLISWRRDTENLLARQNNSSSAREARRLLRDGRYREAFEEALKNEL